MEKTELTVGDGGQPSVWNTWETMLWIMSWILH